MCDAVQFKMSRIAWFGLQIRPAVNYAVSCGQAGLEGIIQPQISAKRPAGKRSTLRVRLVRSRLTETYANYDTYRNLTQPY